MVQHVKAAEVGFEFGTQLPQPLKVVAAEAIDLGRQTVMLTLIIGAPVLISGLVVGVVVSVLQAVTQVQEQTLSFVPKIVAMLLAAAIVGPWMLARLVEFGREMFAGP